MSRSTPPIATPAAPSTITIPDATRFRASSLVCAMVRPEKPVTVITMPESESITCVRSTSTESCDCTSS